MLKAEIVDAELIEKQKKDGSGSYFMQGAWGFTYDRDGKLKRFPEYFEFFAEKNDTGKAIALPVGMYFVSPESMRINFGRLEVGFVKLVPVKSTQKA